MTPTTEASQDRLNKDNEGLVPHLAAAFSLKGLSQINLDPIVMAVACHVKAKQKGVKPVVTIDEMIIKGSSWFPQRIVHSRKQEADRMARFARTYPDVFSLESSRDSVSLASGALFQGSPDPCDEAWYHIVLHRLLPQDMMMINDVLDDLEVKGLTCIHAYNTHTFLTLCSVTHTLYHRYV